MLALETTAALDSETPDRTWERTAAPRPWYIWTGAGAALLIGLYYLLFLVLPLTLPPALHAPSDPVALVWLGTIVIGCLGGAIGFFSHHSWANKVFLVACILMLPRIGLAFYSVLQILTGAPDGVDTLYLRSSLILLTSGLYMAVLAWVTLAAMWRTSTRLAELVLFLFAFLLILTLALAPRVALP